MSKKKKVIIVGAGPGGLCSAMILASRGFDVQVFEKNESLGGRNAAIEAEGFKFDVGPTFLMMKFLLDSVFNDCGLNSTDYMTFTKLDPMYELKFSNDSILMSSDAEKTKQEIERVFPGLSKGYDSFMAHEAKRFQKLLPCLQTDYSSLSSFVSMKNVQALPYLSLSKSVFNVLKNYFVDEQLALLFSFQSKYLGMSAWDCPGGFSILSYIEHAYGVYHVQGGLSEISQGFAKAAQDKGAHIHCSSAVKKMILDNKKVIGIELENGEKIFADEVIVNADFAHAMTELLPEKTLKKYSKENIDKKQFSCSTYMLHLGLDKIFDSQHHTIVFADNYKQNINQVFKEQRVTEDDFSFYVRNASINDNSLAPQGCSSLYVLVPVPNLDAQVNWKNLEAKLRAKVLKKIEEKMGFKNIEKHRL